MHPEVARRFGDQVDAFRAHGPDRRLRHTAARGARARARLRRGGRGHGVTASAGLAGRVRSRTVARRSARPDGRAGDGRTACGGRGRPDRQRRLPGRPRAAGRPALGRPPGPRRRDESPAILTDVRFRAVFFDVGETLVHVDPSFVELFVTVLAGAGHQRAEDEVRPPRRTSTRGSPRPPETDRCGRRRPNAPARSGRRCTTGCSRSSASRTPTASRPPFTESSRGMENYVLFDDVRPTIAALQSARPPARHRVELRGMARGVVRRPRAASRPSPSG